MATEGEENETPEGSAEGTEGDKSKPKLFTQEEVNDINARTRSQAQRAARKEIFSAFGVEDLEELKETVAVLKGAAKGTPKKSAKDEEGDEELRTENAELRKRLAKAEERAAKADALAFEERKREALESTGVSAKAARRLARMLEVEPDADKDEIQAAVRELKRDMPELFKTPEGGEGEEEGEEGGREERPTPQPTRSSTGNPGRAPRPARKAADARTAATSRLHLRHPNLANRDKK